MASSLSHSLALSRTSEIFSSSSISVFEKQALQPSYRAGYLSRLLQQPHLPRLRQQPRKLFEPAEALLSGLVSGSAEILIRRPAAPRGPPGFLQQGKASRCRLQRERAALFFRAPWLAATSGGWYFSNSETSHTPSRRSPADSAVAPAISLRSNAPT